MDNFVKEKLQEWNLSSLAGKYLCSTNHFRKKPTKNCETSAITTNVGVFSVENMIDQEAFLLLNEETLKEMISAIGPRIKLQRKLQELQVN